MRIEITYKIIGVGLSSIYALKYMHKDNNKNKLVKVEIENSTSIPNLDENIILGLESNKGLDTCDITINKKCFYEDRHLIEQVIKGDEDIVLVGSLNEVIASVSIPLMVEMVKKENKKVYVLVYEPFKLNGEKICKAGEEAINKLKKLEQDGLVDKLLIINYDYRKDLNKQLTLVYEEFYINILEDVEKLLKTIE